MREYTSRAVILVRETTGDFNERISLFTEKFGKFRARTISSKKITSKLSGHLEPGDISYVRFVEKMNPQIVDALKIGSLAVSPVDMSLLNMILGEDQPENELWKLLSHDKFSWASALKLLGWDPARAQCSCGGKPEYFNVREQEFYCLRCKTRHGAITELVYITL